MNATHRGYVWNYQMDGAFITGRTLHVLREREGRNYTTKCGHEGAAEEHAFDDTLDGVADRHRCGRCFPDEVKA